MEAQPLVTSRAAVGLHRRGKTRDDAPRGRSAAVLWSGATALVTCLVFTVLESTRVGVPAPFEDAAMLFRYAENLAHGWGITWNVEQPPGLTDGATEQGSFWPWPRWRSSDCRPQRRRAPDLASVNGIGALFGVLNDKSWHRPAWCDRAGGARRRRTGEPVCAQRLLTAGAGVPASGRVHPRRHCPGCTVGTRLADPPPRRRYRRRNRRLVAPRGVRLRPPRSGVRAVAHHPSEPPAVARLAAIVAVVAPFVVLVVLWAWFRVSYFGQLLPTSAVMKSGSLHGSNILFSLQFYASLLLPLVGVLVAAMLDRGQARSWWIAAVVLAAPLLWVNAALPPEFWDKIGLSAAPAIADVATVVFLVPIVVALAVAAYRRHDRSWLFPLALVTFSVAWIAIATTLNWWGRMQWPLVPVLVAMAAGTAVAAAPAGSMAHPSSPGRSPRIVVALLVCVGVLPFHLPIGSYFESPFQTAVSEALRGVDTSGVRVATTEAGLIPLAFAASRSTLTVTTTAASPPPTATAWPLSWRHSGPISLPCMVFRRTPSHWTTVRPSSSGATRNSPPTGRRWSTSLLEK